jgi:hypothetical protein
MGGAYGQKVDGIRGAVLDAARAITPLLADERVAARWGEQSALAELSVGGLAGHLSRALDTVERYLSAPEPPADDLLDPVTYYGLGRSRMDDAQNAGIRQRAEAAGSIGPAALAAEHEARVERVTALLATTPSTRRVAVAGGAVRMLIDDYLPTRLVEIVVHADDLAASVGADPIGFDADATSTVIDILVGIARSQHGDAAVIRALTRRERDAVKALRVL